MKKCLYSKCEKEFEPNKPKQVFCCAVHRVYWNREQNAKISDTPTNYLKPENSQVLIPKASTVSMKDAMKNMSGEKPKEEKKELTEFERIRNKKLGIK
jgi:hypothetical protein